MSESKHTAPRRIRVAQDADGFWTCREAASGSQEYFRSDLVDELLAALKGLLKSHKPGRGQCCAEADAAIDAIAQAERQP